ncbi:MAG: hypothetical protein ACLFSW_00700 [Halobacteriales archaeon]
MTAKDKATNALWWAGWKPLVVGSLGAVVGVLAGYSAGAVGPATTAVGVVVVSLGVFSGWLRRTGFVSTVFAFIVFHVVGPGRVMGSLEAVGVGDNWARFAAEFVLNIGSLVGVEPSREPTVVVGSGVASLALWSLAGAAFGGVLWVGGVYVVNSGYGDVYRRFVDKVEEEGRRLLNAGDEGFHTFTHGEDTMSLVSSAKKYHATNLLIGDSSLSLHHDSTVDMVTREEDISNSTKELYYDQVASVDYEAPFLKIRMSDGQVVRIVTSGKPVEVIAEIEERLARYKASGSAEQTKATEAADGERKESGTTEDETSEGADDLGREIVDEVDEALDAFNDAFEDDGGDREEGDRKEDEVGREDGGSEEA